MDNRDINSIRDVEALNRAITSQHQSERARLEAMNRNNKMMQDLNRWGSWMAFSVFVIFGLWVLGVYVESVVVETLDKIKLPQ